MHPRLAPAFVLAALVPLAAPAPVLAQAPAARDNIDALIEQQAKAHKVPSAFIHKVVKRESNYNPKAKGGSALGLMQIKHATARGLGYKGEAAGLYDPETNLKYGIAYLAGAYRAAKGDLDQAYRYYSRGYYYAAKRLGIETEMPDEAPTTVAGSATDFSKLFGLRTGASGAAVQTASADPNAGPIAGVAGTPALAFAPSAEAALVEVPLPPRRPASLGGGEGAQAAAPAQAEAPAQVAALQAPMQAAAVQPAAQAGGHAATDLVEVPLPPRRPAATVLAAIGRPAAPARRSAEPAPVLEAAAVASGQ